MKQLLFLSLIAFFLFYVSPSAAAQVGPTFSVEAGLDSFAKVDRVLPVRVTVANQGPDRNAEIQIENTDVWHTAPLLKVPIDLPNQSRKQIRLNVMLNHDMRVLVRLVDTEGNSLAEERLRLQMLTPNGFLVGVVASNGSLLNGLAGLRSTLGGRVGVAHLDLHDLPETLQAWSILDMLVFNDVDTSQMSTMQLDRLAHWLHAGGTLLIGGGPNASQTLSGLSAFIPTEEIEYKSVRHPISDLEAYTGGAVDDRGPYVAAVLSSFQADHLISQDSMPLVSSLVYGRGQILYSALDFGLAPMDLLVSQQSFLPQLVGGLTPQAKSILEQSNNNNVLRSLALIPGYSLPRPRVIIIYLLLYILAVGPLNYYLLGRYRKREWAWLTLPLLVLLFCGIGFMRGFQLSGGQPFLRQMTVVYGQATSYQVDELVNRPVGQSQSTSPLAYPLPQPTSQIISQTRLTHSSDLLADYVSSAPLAEYASFAGVFSTRRTAYRLEIDSSTTLIQQPLARTQERDQFTIVYGTPTVVSDLQGDIGSMPSVLARGQIDSPDIRAQLTFNRQSQIIQGKIVNNTGQAIEGAYLVLEHRKVPLDTLQEGETVINDLFNNPNNFYPSANQIANQNLTNEEAIKWASRDIAVKAILNSQPIHIKGLHLVGWHEGSPVNVSMSGLWNRKSEETLLLIRLSSS